MAATKGKRGKRYTTQQKQRILKIAAKEGLTGEQVAKRFGVAQLTFYRWRGPVRGQKAATRIESRLTVDGGALRAEVRARVAQLLPEIIRQEVAQAIVAIFGGRKRGRPRRTAA